MPSKCKIIGVKVTLEQHRAIKDFVQSRGQSITGYFLLLHKQEVEKTRKAAR